MKRNTKQRLALCLTTSLLLGMLPMENTVSSQAADISVVAEKEIAQNTAQTDHGLHNPTTNSDVTTWDCITFGSYWQNDTNGDGIANQADQKQSIVWRVLSVHGDDAFLLADKNLDYQKYNDTLEATDVTWETSTIRSWLNGYGADANVCGKNYNDNNFLDNAFTESEREAILDTPVENPNNPTHHTEGGSNTTDKVYLLSIDEVLEPSYGFIDSYKTKTRAAENTEYAKGLGFSDSYWWLRSPGGSSTYASYVVNAGIVDQFGYFAHFNTYAVRPALHLNLSSTENWSKAETVTTGENMATPSPTPTIKPTASPGTAPTATPTAKPTASPGTTPTATPTAKPTASPGTTPTATPTATPTVKPTTSPGVIPSASPSVTPGSSPSATPNASPSSTPAWLIPEVTYDATEFEAFAGRTKEEAAQKYVEARYAGQSYDETEPSSFYEKQPSFIAPFYPGLLSKDTLGTMLALCNYYRWLAGSESVRGDTYQEDYYEWPNLQQQAFIWRFSPSKPENFPDDKWVSLNTASYEGSMGNTPLEAIKNLINPRISWERNPFYIYEGRECILSPLTSYISMGFSGDRLMAGRRIDGKKDAPFYAFPSEGYIPNDLLPADGVAWNVVLNREDISIPEPKDVCVTITHRESGEKFVKKAEKGNATAAGESIIFEGPAGENMSVYTGTYDVEITGLLDVATGKGAKICYTVNFFDGAECLLPSEVKEVSIDGITKFIVPPVIATTDNLKKLAAILPSEVTVTAENGRKVILPVRGNWVYDAAGSCWKNSIDVAELPSGLTDRSGLLTDCSIACEVGDNRGLTFEMYWGKSMYELIAGCPTDGQGGKITIKWNEASKIDHAVLYQITGHGQGYTASVRYDPETALYGNQSEVENAFVFQANYFIKDSGDYVAVGHTDGEKTAYVSGNIQTLLVTERRTDFGSQTGNSGGSGTGTDTSTGGGSTSSGGKNGIGNADDDSTTDDDSGEDDTNDEENDDTNRKPTVAKVQKFKVTPIKKGFVLTWKKDSKASGYQIQFSTKKNFKGAKKISIKKSKGKYKISKLKAGKKYYVRIRAYRSYKDKNKKTKKAYGKWIVQRKATKK